MIIRECAERFLAGDSLRSICNDLNMRGVRPVKAIEWSPQTMRRMLSSGRISGQRDHHREVVANAVWEAIITPAQTQRIRAKLAAPPGQPHPLRNHNATVVERPGALSELCC